MAERLSELKQEVRGELGLSSYNKKKISYSFIQSSNFRLSKNIFHLYLNNQCSMSRLTHFRQNELLQWLLNTSIYLGTIETPDVFMLNSKRVCHQQSTQLRLQILLQFYQQLPYDFKHKRDRL